MPGSEPKIEVGDDVTLKPELARRAWPEGVQEIGRVILVGEKTVRVQWPDGFLSDLDPGGLIKLTIMQRCRCCDHNFQNADANFLRSVGLCRPCATFNGDLIKKGDTTAEALIELILSVEDLCEPETDLEIALKKARRDFNFGASEDVKKLYPNS